MAVLRDLAEITHWICVIKITPEAAEDPTTPPDERTRGLDMAARLPMRALTRMWQMLLKALEEVALAPNAMMAAEMAVIRLTHVADLPDPESLIRKLQSQPQPAAAAPALQRAAPQPGPRMASAPQVAQQGTVTQSGAATATGAGARRAAPLRHLRAGRGPDPRAARHEAALRGRDLPAPRPLCPRPDRVPAHAGCAARPRLAPRPAAAGLDRHALGRLGHRLRRRADAGRSSATPPAARPRPR